MKKAEIIRILSERLDYPKTEVKRLLDHFSDDLIRLLKDEERISFQGFGTFSTKLSKVRVSFNPSARKRMLLPRKTKILFKPSEVLKEYINKV